MRRAELALTAVLLALAGAGWYAVLTQSAGMSMAMDVSAPAYLGVWLAMLAAMMLPATAPLAVAYGRVARARGSAGLAPYAFSAGYLALWAVAGLLPLAVFVASRGQVAGMAAGRPGPLALGGVLVAAGLYQLSPWKGACLRACRTPLGFVLGHDFTSGPPGGLLAGAAHGVACLGCCWALMAILAVTGLMSLPWMAALALLVLVEKNWRHGERLAPLAGVALIAGGALVGLL